MDSCSVYRNYSINCVLYATIPPSTFQNWDASSVCPIVLMTLKTNGDIWLQTAPLDYLAEFLGQFFSQQQKIHLMTGNEILKRTVWPSFPHTFREAGDLAISTSHSIPYTQVSANNKLIYTYSNIYHNTTDLKSLNIHEYCVNRHESNGIRHPPCNSAKYLVIQVTLLCNLTTTALRSLL
jgi:hypothetical protein